MLPSEPEPVPGDAEETRPNRDATGYDLAPVAVAAPPRRPRRVPVLTVAIALVAVLAGGALFMSGYSLGRHQGSQPGTPASEDAAFQPFWDAYRTIVQRYAGGEVDQKAIVEGAIRGMIESLDDPYSSYLTSEEYRESLQGISGQFEGIGAEIGTKAADGSDTQCAKLGPDCHLVIIAPIDGSPAQKAGLRAGDVVQAVDGSTLDGLTVEEARDRIRGKQGTTVVLTITREGAAAQDISIVRDVIQQREVVDRDYAGGTIGYVRLTGFSEAGAKAVTAAVKADVDAGRKKLILDLRGNPGGFVTAARTVASQFIGSGPIFWQEDAAGKQVATDAESGGVATSTDIQLIVLVDRGSASASEIVAGAIQDTKRGQLVGETSFGKGTVQQWLPLDGDNGGFRLTIAKWLTPEKRWIHHKGLEPDVAVDPAPTDESEDPVLDKALELLGGSAILLRTAA